MNEATKAATLAAVQHQQLAGFESEHNNFYGNTSEMSEYFLSPDKIQT